MLQAIQTKCLCPTNFRGAHIKAIAAAGTITVPWDYELDMDENHHNAARVFAVKFGWKGELSGGVLKDGSYVWVYGALQQVGK